MDNLTTLLLKIPRNTEVTPEAAQTFLSALTQINRVGFFNRLLGKKPQTLALEIVLANQQISFEVTANSNLIPFVETQIGSSYPLVLMEKIKDPLEAWQGKSLETASLRLGRGNYYPIATPDKFHDIDPLAPILSVLSKATPDELAIIQYSLSVAPSTWQNNGLVYAERGIKNENGTWSPRADQTIIKEKVSFPGFSVSLKIASNTKRVLSELASAYGVFTRADGNYLTPKRTRFGGKPSFKDIYKRVIKDPQILNILELSGLWHLPGEKIKIASILWGTTVLSEAPEMLPVATNTSDEAKKNINFFARTLFKNQQTTFGIKDKDRRRHIWTIGKTGTGKSTLIANMAIDDFKKDRGVAVIDPHGDLIETLLDFVPKKRIANTIVFNPADRSFPIIINPLEVRNKEEGELVASGLLSIFTKIWENVWSARMEYILRNCFLTLTQVPGTTLADVLTLLTNKTYRTKVLQKIHDHSLQEFWQGEYERMPDRLQKEAIAPIQNKVGQFVTSPLIRNIIANPKSSIHIDKIMNEGKILLANLSAGRIGEDNAHLLGAMLITQTQLAAMRRVDVREEERRDFYLYVDEFQNFATSSFIKILSEARKYRLNLMLANQYMAQVPDEIQKAILGNAGSIISFAAGAQDAAILHKEFAEVFAEKDLVNLSNYQIAIKLMIDGHSTRPFLATTLPLPASKNQNRDKVIKASRERWTKKVK